MNGILIQSYYKVWVESEESKWYQGANPQHITTNNNVEATNQVFKKEFTGRTRLSFPNMFKKLKDLVTDWGRRKKVEDADPDKVPIDLLRQAEELIERCNREDKKKNLLLSKPAKAHHRNMIKKDFGIVRGFVQETNIVPRSTERLINLGKRFTLEKLEQVSRLLMNSSLMPGRLPLSKLFLRMRTNLESSSLPATVMTVGFHLGVRGRPASMLWLP